MTTKLTKKQLQQIKELELAKKAKSAVTWAIVGIIIATGLCGIVATVKACKVRGETKDQHTYNTATIAMTIGIIEIVLAGIMLLGGLASL